MDGVQESSKKSRRLRFPPSSIPHGVGEIISDARKQRRWSQARLACKAGLSRAAVYRVEALDGKTQRARGVRADTLFRLAHALDMTIGELVPDWPEWEPIRGSGLGEAARERRRKLGLTIAEVAASIGVSEATLSRHERGLVTSRNFVRQVGDELIANNAALTNALNPDMDPETAQPAQP